MENMFNNVSVDDAVRLSQIPNPDTGLPYISQEELITFFHVKAKQIQQVVSPYMKNENAQLQPDAKLI